MAHYGMVVVLHMLDVRTELDFCMLCGQSMLFQACTRDLLHPSRGNRFLHAEKKGDLIRVGELICEAPNT